MASATSFFPSPATSSAERVERSLRAALDAGVGGAGPARLREAMAYAVFPGGSRLRPRLCIGVAQACGDLRPEIADRGAAAVELVHCASLVHDDLPCFDDAETRRGKAAVHVLYGVPTALLVGDALIVLAFQTLAPAGADAIALLAEATGAATGIIAGQAWESEPVSPLDEYHRAKTGSLFAASAALGAVSAGGDPTPWRAFGEALGRAYQAADDVADVVGDAGALGKPVGRDAVLDRPSLVRAHGLDLARRRVRDLVDAARAAIPPCPRRETLHAWLDAFARRVEAA